MAGIRFQQIAFDSNPGLEGTLTAGTTGPIRVKTGAGLTRTASGLIVDGTESTFKKPARVRATGNVTIATPGTTHDGVTLSTGDRILLADQTTTSQDGLYVFDTGATPLVRTTDAPAGDDAAGWYIQVLEGTTHADTLFRVDANAGGAIIGTDGWTLATFSGSDTTRSAGAGLVDGAGLDLDVNTGDGIAISSDRVIAQVATAGAGQQYGGLVNTRNSTGAGAGTANQGYLAIATDNSTLEISASNQITVKNAGITETQLNTSVAGDGLTGGGGSALAVGAGTGLAVAANSIGIDTATGSVTVTGGTWTFPTDNLQITGSPNSANDAVNKAYVDNLITGVAWLEPVVCLCLVGNATVATINGLGDPGAVSDIYVVTDAGTLTLGSLSVVAGDVVQWDDANTQWIRLAAGVGGFVPAGFRVALSSVATLVSPYTDGVDDGKIVEFDGTDNNGLNGTVETPTNGDAVLVVSFNDGSSDPVLVNQAYVFNGTVPTGSWTQFSGAGGLNAGTGLAISGNTINFVAADNSLTVNANDAQVKIEAAGSGTGGLTVQTAGLRVNVEAAGAGTGGLSLTATGIRVVADATSTGSTASVVALTANGVGVRVDDSTIEGSAAGGSLRVKDLGITTGKLAANAVSLAKMNLQFREEEFAAASFTNAGGGEYQVSLAATPVTGTQADFYAQCYRNGVADMTNQGSTTAATSLTEFRVLDSSGGKLRVGGDTTATGNTYRVRYLSTAV